MQNDYPLVSVIIPTYKRPEKLPRAINSVLNQTYPNVEIIVVDDNNPGTDGRRLTEQIMEPYTENPRVKYIKHERNMNGAVARNTGAAHSNAKYIALLDDDDEFLPKKIESQVKTLENRSDDWGACYSMAYSKKENMPYIPLQEHREGSLYLCALTRELSFLAGSNLMVRRSVWDEVGGFTETFLRNQDKEFTTKILKKYKLAYCPEPGLVVYIHTEKLKTCVLDVDRQYYESFRDQIEALSDSDRKTFECIFKRDMFFHALRADYNYMYCFKEIIHHNVPWFATMLYIIKKAWNSKFPPKPVDNIYNNEE